MMTCDKQNENFITYKEQPSEAKNRKSTKNSANTIISHSQSNLCRKNNENFKFNKIKNLTMFSTKSAQTQDLQYTTNTKCIMKQQQQQPQHKTIITKVLQQEMATMVQQKKQQTPMTLKEYFKFTNATAAKTTSKRINKNISDPLLPRTATATPSQPPQKKLEKSSTLNLGQQQPQQQQYQLKQRPTIAEPITNSRTNLMANISSLLSTTSFATLPTSSSSLSTSSPPPPPAAATTSREQITTKTTALTLIPVSKDIVENSQSKLQQCNNVCISSKYGSKQKCVQQQHCKSANISNNTKNHFNNIRTYAKTNINTNITTAPVTPVAVASATVEDITKNIHNINTTTSNTTNKANIRTNISSPTANNITTTTTTIITAAAATRPTQLSSSPPLVAANYRATAKSYCQAFPLRHRFSRNIKQLECLLRTLVFSFSLFVMSMQYQTGKW